MIADPETPPLARGIPFAAVSLAFALGNTPACAGNTRRRRERVRAFRKHPRLRGEYHLEVARFLSGPETPPLARGILSPTFRMSIPFGNTPACAGNTGGLHRLRGPYRKHPRLRGEYLSFPKSLQLVSETPPLARGIPSNSNEPRRPPRNTPACAGNTKHGPRNLSRGEKHPRLRGEY